jgi:hypothetical protein
MGLFKSWKQLKAVGRAANEAASTGDRQHGGHQHEGFLTAFANVMVQALGPQLAATAATRGSPLAGSEQPVVDGSAWSGPLDAAVTAVRARDGAFAPDALVDFADQVFGAVVSVWAGASAGTVRPVLSDDLWEPLAAATGTGTHVAAARFLGQENGAGQLSGLHAGDWYDSAQLTFRVTLNPQALPPNVPPDTAEWQEEWLFQRSVRPGGDPMAKPQTCPSCGAPTDTDEQDACVHCHQVVPYLTTGWLVAHIVSHNPVQAMMHDRMAEQLREHPETLQQIPPSMLRLLPPDLQAEFADRLPPAG